MLSRLIRGNAALYAHFGNVWVCPVVALAVCNLVAMAEALYGAPSAGYLIICALADVLLLRYCLHAGDQEPTQAEREAEYLAQIRHKAVSEENLRKARRDFHNGASFRQVSPRIEGTEL